MAFRSFFSYWRQDLPASLVVFLVALPLCLGVALASGAPLLSGLVAGIVGGLVIGSLSRSPLGVSGPAAGLVGIVLPAITELGFEGFLLAVVIMGVLQVVLGFSNAGIIAYYFPTAVIRGMLAGIGLTIFIKQLPHAVGYDADFMGDESFVQPDAHNSLSELAYMLDALNPGAVIITLVCIMLMVLWERPFIKQRTFLRLIPGPLLAVIVGVVLSRLFVNLPDLAISTEHFVDIPLRIAADDLHTPDFSVIGSWALWKVAIVMLMVASLETLLCAEATDKMDPWKRTTPANRELRAQGIGNIISGLLGGLPLTQVIVRSSANVQAGGRTRLSAIVHGALLLLSMLLAPGLIREIPLAALAAILLVVGFKLIKPSQFQVLWREGWMRFVPFVVTVFCVYFIDLLWGVGLGLSVAIMHILWMNYKKPFHFDPHRYRPGMPIYMELSEDVTFLSKAGIKRALNELPAGSRIVIDASRTLSIDPDVREIIDDFVTGTEHGVLVETSGLDRLRQPAQAQPDPVDSMKRYTQATQEEADKNQRTF
ncbi:MAG TPA: SulP family inorganic anion transporter [Flavobacteriales bacterium]|nr:SulP family inorganic anion transporter [Flavobacteriales bacterium]